MHGPRLPEAKKFLQGRVDFLKESLAGGSPTPHLALASCYQRLGQCGTALEHVQEVARTDADDPEVRWLRELLSRQEQVSKQMQEKSCLLHTQSLPLQMPKPVQVSCTVKNEALL